MNKTAIFVIRLILAIFLSFVLIRIFRPELHPAFFVILAAFLVGMAYALEFIRGKRSSDKEQQKH